MSALQDATVDAAVWRFGEGLIRWIERDNFRYIVSIRRELHENPELAFKEFKTSQRIREELGKIEGIRILESPAGGTGVIAVVDGAGVGKTILFRADMDALPIQEIDWSSDDAVNTRALKRRKLVTGYSCCAICGRSPDAAQRQPQEQVPSLHARSWRKTCVSKVDGVSHACGHDGHVAMLLGAARALATRRHELRGRVVLLFQPAEERHPITNPMGGAIRMIRDLAAGEELCLALGAAAAVEQPPARPESERHFTDGQDTSMDGRLLECVDEVYGAHLWNHSSAGYIGCAPGSVSANSDSLELVVEGKGGHGSAPQGTVDAVVVAAQLVTALQGIVSRNVSPTESAIITLGKIEGGFAPNAIAESVRILGTVRTYTSAVKRLMRRRINEVARGIAASHGTACNIVVKYNDGYPACMNDATCAAGVIAAASDVMGDKLSARLVGSPTPNMVGEDFAFFLDRKPGAFFFVGSNPDAIFGMDPALPPEPEEEEHGAKKFIMHHTPEFDVHEGALWCGAAMWVALATHQLR